MTKRCSESGKTIMEMLAVLGIIGVLSISATVGYKFLMEYWQRKETVKQIDTLAVNYQATPIKAGEDGRVSIKAVYPSAERASATKMKLPKQGTVSIKLFSEGVNAFALEIEGMDEAACVEYLKNGGYHAVRVAPGTKNGNGIVVDASPTSNDPNDHQSIVGKKTLKSDLTDEDILKICGNGSGFASPSLWFGGCPQQGWSYWHTDGLCHLCAFGIPEDRYGTCCTNGGPDIAGCGVCSCADLNAGTPHCLAAEGGNGTCVECLDDTHCAGREDGKTTCDTTTHTCTCNVGGSCTTSDGSAGFIKRSCECAPCDESTGFWRWNVSSEVCECREWLSVGQTCPGTCCAGGTLCHNFGSEGQVCTECWEDYDPANPGREGTCPIDRPQCQRVTGSPAGRCFGCAPGLFWNETAHRCTECLTDYDATNPTQIGSCGPERTHCNPDTWTCECPTPGPTKDEACNTTCGCVSEVGLSCNGTICVCQKTATEGGECSTLCGCDNGMTCGSDNKCHCPEGTSLVGGECKCTNPDYVWREDLGRCDCPESLPISGQTCNNTCGCRAGTRLFCPTTGTKVCSCPTGAVWNSATNQCECPEGQEWDETTKSCVCPGTLPGQGDTCTTACGCVAGSRLSCISGTCQCPTGTTWSATTNKCECTDTTRVWDDTTGACVCTNLPGYGATCTTDCGCITGSGLSCISGTCQCPTGMTWSPMTNSCQCPLGKVWDSATSTCVCPASPSYDQACTTECGCAAGSGLSCVSGLCKCPEGQTWNSSTLRCEVPARACTVLYKEKYKKNKDNQVTEVGCCPDNRLIRGRKGASYSGYKMGGKDLYSCCGDDKDIVGTPSQTSSQCCPHQRPGLGETCTASCGCAGGYTCSCNGVCVDMNASCPAGQVMGRAGICYRPIYCAGHKEKAYKKTEVSECDLIDAARANCMNASSYVRCLCGKSGGAWVKINGASGCSNHRRYDAANQKNCNRSERGTGVCTGNRHICDDDVHYLKYGGSGVTCGGCGGCGYCGC